jgi:hypothetical protein
MKLEVVDSGAGVYNLSEALVCFRGEGANGMIGVCLKRKYHLLYLTYSTYKV